MGDGRAEKENEKLLMGLGKKGGNRKRRGYN